MSKIQGRDSLRRIDVPFVIAAFGAAIATASCAAHPNDIAAQDVYAAQYDNYSCPDLAGEYRRLNGAIAGAGDYQRSVRVSDIYGYMVIVPVIHFPMPLGRMLGSDREAQIAYLEGEQSATIRMALAKGCIRATPIPLTNSGYILK
jgi:hypothetical protein